MTNFALGRTEQAILTNKSGGSVAQGDVVIIDSSTAASFTTTTTGAYASGRIGVVLEPAGIANNAAGAIAFSGYVPKIALSGSASLGDLVKTHTVAKQGVRHAAPSVSGDFAQVLGTGTSPAALLFGYAVVGGGVSAFTGLSDAPASYTSQANKVVSVKSDETGLEFTAPSSGGVSWTQVVNESGASFANFTGVAGTWSSDGTVIKNTNTGASVMFSRYNTLYPIASCVFEAEVQMRTDGASRRGGFVIGSLSTDTGAAMAVYVDPGNDNVYVERGGVTVVLTRPATIAVNTWYKLRAVSFAGSVNVYLDGTFLGTGHFGIQNTGGYYLGLYCYQAEVWWRNIKAWVLTGGLPA